MSGCASIPSNHSASNTNLLDISPDVQIVIRHDLKRPYYIARRQRAYSSTELRRYLATFFAHNTYSPTRAIALIPDDKIVGFSRTADSVIAFAESHHIRVVYLSPQGNSIDALLLGDSLSPFGVRCFRAQ